MALPWECFSSWQWEPDLGSSKSISTGSPGAATPEPHAACPPCCLEAKAHSPKQCGWRVGRVGPVGTQHFSTLLSPRPFHPSAPTRRLLTLPHRDKAVPLELGGILQQGLPFGFLPGAPWWRSTGMGHAAESFAGLRMAGSIQGAAAVGRQTPPALEETLTRPQVPLLHGWH